MKTMALGIIACICLIASVCCLYCKKPVWGFVSSAATILLTFLTGCSWKNLLAVSGKDTALLGFQRYPAVLVILAVLLFAALAAMAVSIIGMAGQNKRGNAM